MLSAGTFATFVIKIEPFAEVTATPESTEPVSFTSPDVAAIEVVLFTLVFLMKEPLSAVIVAAETAPWKAESVAVKSPETPTIPSKAEFTDVRLPVSLTSPVTSA